MGDNNFTFQNSFTCNPTPLSSQCIFQTAQHVCFYSCHFKPLLLPPVSKQSLFQHQFSSSYFHFFGFCCVGQLFLDRGTRAEMRGGRGVRLKIFFSQLLFSEKCLGPQTVEERGEFHRAFRTPGDEGLHRSEDEGQTNI